MKIFENEEFKTHYSTFSNSFDIFAYAILCSFDSLFNGYDNEANELREEVRDELSRIKILPRMEFTSNSTEPLAKQFLKCYCYCDNVNYSGLLADSYIAAFDHQVIFTRMIMLAKKMYPKLNTARYILEHSVESIGKEAYKAFDKKPTDDFDGSSQFN